MCIAKDFETANTIDELFLNGSVEMNRIFAAE